MDSRPIFLIEDNPDDEKLTLRAFTKRKVGNPVIVARDGQEAVVGGVAGSVLSNGSGLGTVGGAAVGGVIGNQVGKGR